MFSSGQSAGGHGYLSGNCSSNTLDHAHDGGKKESLVRNSGRNVGACSSEPHVCVRAVARTRLSMCAFRACSCSCVRACARVCFRAHLHLRIDICAFTFNYIYASVCACPCARLNSCIYSSASTLTHLHGPCSRTCAFVRASTFTHTPACAHLRTFLRQCVCACAVSVGFVGFGCLLRREDANAHCYV